MKEHPILFNAAMVKAVLSGRKTQTRRPLKSQPDTSLWKPSAIIKEKEWLSMPCMGPGHHIEENMWGLYNLGDKRSDMPYIGIKCPYGKAGDRLWVRETFTGCDLPDYGDMPCIVYDDEWEDDEYKPREARPWARKFGRIPSIHMPRDASRINLEITDIRIERVQDISYIEAKAEGVNYERGYTDPRDVFRHLWDSLYKNWNDDPWVWVTEFKVVL